jgi:N-acetylglutamate synthase-like GNAT family acetyltransferase
MITLRAASETDAGIIRDLVHSGRINPTGLDWQRFILAQTAEGEVIGCGQVKPHRDGSKELASIVVHPDWRGRGVARKIIEELLASHPGELYLMCRSELGSLYEKFGFRAIQPGEMPKYFRRISRLAGLLESLAREESSLLVMKRDADA